MCDKMQLKCCGCKCYFDYQSPGPVILSHPQDVEIVWGHRKVLTVEADGASPLYYQWYFEQNKLPGMLSHTMSILLITTTL